MNRKAVALISGGLDSILAVKTILSHGIEIIGINFISPFFNKDMAVKVSEQLGIALEVFDITLDLLEVVKSPKYGYGKNMNPCIDCHALMIKKAGEFMENIGASFIITGEVLGQRPKSQSKDTLYIVEKESGFKGKIIRPLSQKLLLETLPEKEGLIDRDKMFSFSGRSRKPQMELAKELGIKSYPTPAGGCKLTEPSFSNRLKELLFKELDFSITDIELLRIGRHFRLDNGVKVIVGRNKDENEKLLKLKEKGYIFLEVKDYKSPITIIKGTNKEAIKIAAAITARYSDAKNEDKITVSYWKDNLLLKKSIITKPLSIEKIEKLRV
ncbi:MAG: tRNA 4-thiouridine(8) synthase ThiI [bacterium]|nr:tRNA 4-thiouridine(8) synthase ThiI [bacterium]